ncbi:MAG TPA: hypothetical protein VFH15_13070 [Pyrinomonadaceae bacterium]|nr:hypothetical protein [Pyrinomonadaceae bacterium]
MNVALGLRVHSGWAALVVVGKHNGDFVIVDRRRIELVENEWQKQPYHAAENLKRDAARDLVKRGIAVARRNAGREIRAALKRERQRENQVTACAVLVTDPMPAWSTEEILAVHFRMHKAEGVLFRDALIRAAEACRLAVVAIPEKQLAEQAVNVLKTRANDLSDTISTLGKSVGPPWGKDQKEATVAALVAQQYAP